MNEVLKFIFDILKVPSVLVGLMALIGLLAQKKPATDVVKGTIKTILGFIVLGGGAGVLVGALNPLGKMFQEAFHVQGVIPNNEAIVSIALGKYGAITAYIMAFGMCFNILIARFTRLKYIFLTGHHTLYMACIIGIILQVAGFQGYQLILVGSIVLGLVMAVFPAMAQRHMRKITGTDEIAFGHFGTIGYVLAGFVGEAIGKGSKSTEEINLPKNLSFLRDTSISISLTMMVIYLVLATLSGKNFIETTLSNGDNFLVYSIIQAITFAAGVFLDCPVVFPYAPNAVLVGFLFSFVGGIVGLLILGQLNLVLILPGVVPHFFCGATSGVFANATGGRRGAMLGAFVHGLLITFLPVLLLPVLGNLGFANTTFSDADFCGVGIILGNMARFFSTNVITVIAVAILVILVVLNYILPKKKNPAASVPAEMAK